MNNYMNPYLNADQPYQQAMQTPQMPFMNQQQVVKVNGENGARSFQLGANSSALLLDECGTIVWLVTSDGAGYKTVSPYDIAPHQLTKAPDYSSLEERISRLEEYINGNTNNSTAVKRKNGTKSNDSSDASAD